MAVLLANALSVSWWHMSLKVNRFICSGGGGWTHEYELLVVAKLALQCSTVSLHVPCFGHETSHVIFVILRAKAHCTARGGQDDDSRLYTRIQAACYCVMALLRVHSRCYVIPLSSLKRRSASWLLLAHMLSPPMPV
jgi:hypothetical protein